MKIIGFHLYTVQPRWLFLKVETDEGICGWGEPVIEGRADTVRAAVKELKEYLIGKDPMRIEAVSYTHLDVYKRQVLPILITSPTARICVPSLSSAPLNFSNAHRANLITI